MEHVPIDLLWDTLRMLPALEWLHLNLSNEIDMPQVLPTTAVSLPKLVGLALYGDLSSFFSGWRPLLETPSIRSLGVNCEPVGALSPWYFDAVADKITDLAIGRDSGDLSRVTIFRT